MQHVYSIVFSAVITGLMAGFILYNEYGFWHEKYSRTDVEEVISAPAPEVASESPKDMIGGFFKEAGERLNAIRTSTSSLLEGKEEYTKESDVVE